MKEEITLPKGTVIPNHVVIIPDGNRRWARAKGLPTLEGHKKGFDMAVILCRQARRWGIHTLTLWGFSTENWDRTPAEVAYLMRLYSRMIDKVLKEAKEDDVKIIHLGRKDRLPKFLIAKIAKAMDETKNNKSYILNIALDYGGQDDILRAVNKMIADKVAPGKVDKKMMEDYLDTKNQPYPYADLMIRTSGEQRLSGMLLWQSAYSEFYFENDHFPDFTPEKLKEAILDFSRRRRRFGGNDADQHLKFDPALTAKLELSWWRLKKVPQGMGVKDFIMRHIKEQYGLSKTLAKEAAKLMLEALVEEKDSKFDAAIGKMKKFYELIKGELKLAFEPRIVASLDVNLSRENGEDEEATKEYLAEVYRISMFQAQKAAHLRVLANIEKNKKNWKAAEDYLQKYYKALKERVA